MKAGVVSRTDYRSALKVARDAIGCLSSRGVEIVIETDTALALDMREETDNLHDLEADFLVTIGGDGTTLRAAMELKEPDTPLLGINMGRRGFLTEIYKDEFEWAFERILEGDYSIQDCLKLRSKIVGSDDVFPDSLNEVLVASSLPSKMILFRISVDGYKITEIQADGCIVSTPTGSTAYNLSAGGSIIAPGVESIMVTAICPYSYFRSIALPPDSEVEIELLKPGAEAMTIVDGRSYNAVKPLSTVKVWASPNRTRFIRFDSFYSRLERRLTFLQSQ
ncbi:MAG: NAD(+)/NADH kinase [Candidatus Bathyarchaeia archaeon]